MVSRGTGKRTTVTSLSLNVADNGTLRQRAQRRAVSNVQRGLLSTVDELASIHALSGNEVFMAQLVTVWVSEGHNCKRSTTARIVNDVLHNSSDVTMPLSIIQTTELCSTFSGGVMGFEDPTGTLTLSSNYSPHLKHKSTDRPGSETSSSPPMARKNPEYLQWLRLLTSPTTTG
eukprot:scpid98318/ scgid27944/ 